MATSLAELQSRINDLVRGEAFNVLDTQPGGSAFYSASLEKSEEAENVSRSGNHRRAADLYREVFREAERVHGERESEAYLWMLNVGIELVKAGEYEEAKKALLEGREVWEEDKDWQRLRESDEWLARCGEGAGKYAEAQSYRKPDEFGSIICANRKECPLKLPISKDQLNRCSGCKSVYYCSRKCQGVDWRYHKNHCKELADA